MLNSIRSLHSFSREAMHFETVEILYYKWWLFSSISLTQYMASNGEYFLLCMGYFDGLKRSCIWGCSFLPERDRSCVRRRVMGSHSTQPFNTFFLFTALQPTGSCFMESNYVLFYRSAHQWERTSRVSLVSWHLYKSRYIRL